MSHLLHQCVCFAFSIGLITAFDVETNAQEKQEAPVVPPREGKREKLKLFNGKDLTGWVGHEKLWSVVDGVIVGKNTEPVPVSTYLLTERKFSDFRLVFESKLVTSEMHSGIAMWGRLAPEQKDKFTYAGHLVMYPSGYGFYDLYGRQMLHQNADKAKSVGKQHDWNKMEILAQGNRIRFVLNGTLTAAEHEQLESLVEWSESLSLLRARALRLLGEQPA